ncbi:uncharacterized protein VTP21DRAFT_8791 [Calcarisporiella thermophila]|uniref:uncharacterized protein n=1 Tax=Calcarisporiella thermophila TaxID=911321 RepID=UPI0037427CE1
MGGFILWLLCLWMLAIPANAETCFDIPNPLSPSKRVAVSCPLESRANSASVSKAFAQTQPSPSSVTNYFHFDITCQASPEQCSSANELLRRAGEIISEVVELKQPVSVNASFFAFCRELSICPERFVTLGGAAPARVLPAFDSEDGVKRLIPQALVKQLGLYQHPQYSQFDIHAMFNSEAPFWFSSSGTPIQKNQSDFLFVVVHELIHGLGFGSGWSDYVHEVPIALTPDIGILGGRNAPYTFDGFYEFIFDKFLVTLPDLSRLTTKYTRLLNEIPGINSTFPTIQDFVANLTKSPEYMRIGSELLQIATSKGKLGFMPVGGSQIGDVVVLETSLKPFSDGSSVSHVDYATYTNTSDFLMRFVQDQGVRLEEGISRGGGAHPIGPKLRKMLASLGYVVKEAGLEDKPPYVDGKAVSGVFSSSQRMPSTAGWWVGWIALLSAMML